jgi:hypothetical protein
MKGVDALVFVGALSDYELLCAEDGTTNRLVESLRLFEQMINNPWLKSKTVVLLLNKTDIFSARLQSAPLANFFPDYTVGDDPLFPWIRVLICVSLGPQLV